MANVAVAGAKDVEPWTHEIERCPVGRYVQQPRPEIEIPAVAGDEHVYGDWACHVDISCQWFAVECQDVRTVHQVAIVACARRSILIEHGTRRIRHKCKFRRDWSIERKLSFLARSHIVRHLEI